MSTPPSLLSLSLLSLTTLTSAFSIPSQPPSTLNSLTKVTTRNLKSGSAIGPISSADWASHFSTVNATGTASLKGFNISAPYPGTPSDDWSWTIKVKADIPYQDNKTDFFTGTWIQLAPPDSLLRDKSSLKDPKSGGVGKGLREDPSWAFCYSVYTSKALLTESETVDGGCKGVVPDECLAALNKALADDFARHQGMGCLSLLEAVKSSDACKGVLDVDNGGLAGMGSGCKWSFSLCSLPQGLQLTYL